MIKISIDPDFEKVLPDTTLHVFEFEVTVTDSSDAFWKEANKKLDEISEKLNLEEISQIPSNHTTREAYKKLGKDPSRYRPSAEALLRRVVNGKGLYKVNNLVDCLNLVSVLTGFSIGGFDASKIAGNARLSVGDQSPYEAIGRGNLNIEFLPTLYDNLGPFGTPTSDSMRTMITPETTKFLLIFYNFLKADNFSSSSELCISLFENFAGARLMGQFVI